MDWFWIVGIVIVIIVVGIVTWRERGKDVPHDGTHIDTDFSN